MLSSVSKGILAMALALAAVPVAALDFVDVPVTLWDFRSDGSCPDFNPGVSFGSKDIVSGVTQYNCWNPLTKSYEATTAYTDGDGTPTLILHDPVLNIDIDTFTWSYPVETVNLVAATLDADGLPQRGSNCSFSYEVGRWFRDWVPGAAANTQFPLYKKDVSGVHTPVETDGDGGFTGYTLGSDTAYKNQRFEKFIRFLPRVSTVAPFDTVWEYRNNSCYLLDGQGFGAEPGTKNWAYHSADGTGDEAWVVTDFNAGKMRPTLNDLNAGNTHVVRGGSTVYYGADPSPHNYSYSMMLHRPFVYKQSKNLFFSFRGDDDVWVFINGRLAIDIGGLHDPVEKTVSLNTLDASFGLVDGATAELAFFFVERQADGSNCLISTNIVDGKPVEIGLTLEPSGNIPAGGSASIKVSLPSDTGNVSSELRNVRVLTPFEAATGTPYSETPVMTDDSTWSFSPTKAWVTVRIPFIYTRVDGIDLRDTATWTVLPGAPAAIDIEGSSGKPADGSPGLWAKQEKTLVTIGATETEKSDFYAVLRDVYGNWIGPDAAAAWQSIDPAIAVASAGIDVANGQGRAARGGTDGTTTFTVTAGSGGFTDQIQVEVSSIPQVPHCPGIVAIRPTENFRGSDTVSLVFVDPSFPGTIRYTLDGTEPNAGSLLYTGPIVLSATTTIRAYGYAPGFVDAPFLSETYTRIPFVVSAEYIDSTGDGRIDHMVADFDFDCGSSPVSAAMVDPFDRSVVSAAASISRSGTRLVLTLADPFPYAGVTVFAPAFLATFSGGGYAADSVMVSDAVGPVVDRALYQVGVTNEFGIKEPDTLKVTFTEELQNPIGAGLLPFTFGRGFTPYTLSAGSELPPASWQYLFTVPNPSTFPLAGDSLWIAELDAWRIADMGGHAHIWSVGSRHVPLDVKEPPYRSYPVKTVGPFDPVNDLIPDVFLGLVNSGKTPEQAITIRTGTAAVTELSRTFSGDLAARFSISVVVYDALGNKIASCNGFAHSSADHMQAAVTTTPEGKTIVTVFWDGRNKNDRTVAGGTYVVDQILKDTIDPGSMGDQEKQRYYVVVAHK